MASERRKRGFLLSFEGIEGCGKTTQLRRLAHRLRSLGYLVIETREPGGSPISEQIRTVLLDTGNRGIDVVGLYLDPPKGALVLCDRYADATLAYQGFGRRLGGPVIQQLNGFASGGLVPNLTILLDIPVALGLERKRRAGGLDRLDLEGAAFHRTVRKGYLRIAQQEPRRVQVIDGTAPIDQVTEAVQRIVEGRLRTSKNQLTRVETHAV